MQVKMETQDLGFRQALAEDVSPPGVFMMGEGSRARARTMSDKISALKKIDLSESQLLAVLGLLILPILGFTFHPSVAAAVRTRPLRPTARPVGCALASNRD